MKKRYKIILVVILFLVALRLALPYIIKTVANKQLANLEEYTGYIHDIDLHLYRGAYQIDSITIQKRESPLEQPLFTAREIDISIQWNALFKGAIEGEFKFVRPQVNFVKSSNEKEQQYGQDVDWTEPLKELMPITINHIQIVDGEINFYDMDANKPMHLYLRDFNADFKNINNANDQTDSLPSQFQISAVSLGEGNLNVKGDANFLKEIPDIDYEFTFEGVDVTALNDFTKEYVSMDTERGTFDLYHELAIKDGQMTGYIKPLLTNLKIIKWKEGDDQNVLQWLGEAGIALIAELFENQPKDQFGSSLPLEGDLNQPDFKVMTAIWNTLKNAFIDALKKNTGDKIDISDLEKENT